MKQITLKPVLDGIVFDFFFYGKDDSFHQNCKQYRMYSRIAPIDPRKIYEIG
jgi:hypothetical protein